MKINKYQWGGVYNATPLSQPVSQPAGKPGNLTSSETKKKTPFMDKIMDMLDKDMLNSDRQELYAKWGNTIAQMSATGEDADPMTAIMFMNDVKQKVNYFKEYNTAYQEMANNNAYQDVALNAAGEMIVQDQENNGQLCAVTTQEFHDGEGRYVALNYQQVADLRSQHLFDNTELTAAVARSVSMDSIQKKMRDFTREMPANEISAGVSNAEAARIMRGQNIINGIAEGDYQKLDVKQKADLNTYLQYAWDTALDRKDKEQIMATVAAQGLDPTDSKNCLNMLFNTYKTYVNKEITTSPEKDQTGRLGGGGGSDAMVDLKYVEAFANNEKALNNTVRINFANDAMQINVPGYDYGKLKKATGTDGKAESFDVPYITGMDLITKAAGVSDMATGENVIFGTQPLRKADLNGVMVDTGDVTKVKMPVTRDNNGNVRIDFDKMHQAQAAVDEIKHAPAGSDPRAILYNYFPDDNSVRYNSATQTIEFSDDSSQYFAMVKAYMNSKWNKTNDFDEDDEGLSVTTDDVMGAYRQVCTASKNNPLGIDEKRFDRSSHMMEGTLYVPLNQDLRSVNTDEYVNKSDKTHNAEKVAYQNEVQHAKDAVANGRTNFQSQR